MRSFSCALVIALCSLGVVTSPLVARSREIPVDPTCQDKPATIKVLLHDKQERLFLEVRGAYTILCPHTHIEVTTGFAPKKGMLTVSESGFVWGELMPGTYGMRIVPTDKETTIFVGGIQYKGCVEVYDVGGSLRVINEVDVESYLRSTLALEFAEITNAEVLNALAIVARTKAYYQIQKAGTAPWQVVAEEVGYTGVGLTLQHLPLEKAITATRHAVMTYEGGAFAASWTMDSAGKTASLALMGQASTSPKGTTLPAALSSRVKSGWSFQISKQELGQLTQLSSLHSVSIFAEKESGKVYALRLEDPTHTKTIEFATLQQAIGKNRLKSNDFTVEVLPETIRFKGYGTGEGMGLCMQGATKMAEQGWDAKRILLEFFPDTKLEKIRVVTPSAP